MNIICDRYCTYLHINEVGVFYIGCGVGRRPWRDSPRSILWKQAACNGYSVLILGEFEDQQDAWELEKKLIAYFKPPCNISLGGPGAPGCIRTPETRDKVSVSRLGEKHPNHKLTEKQVLAIREDARTHRLVAIDYGISQGLISRIKTNKSWKHI